MAATTPDLRGLWPVFGEVDGPASYAAGGFVVDCRKALSAVVDASLVLRTRGATLVPYAVHATLDSPTAGQVTFKLMRRRFDRTSAVGNVQNQPAGVTVASASGSSTAAEAAHTHPIDHDHATTTTSTPTAAGVGVNTVGGLDAMTTHTHAVDIPNLVGTSGAGTSHSHVYNGIFQHAHVSTQTVTDVALVEFAAGTSLSTSRWWFFALGLEAA